MEPLPERFRDCNLIIWDGKCDFCRKSVDWLLSKRAGKFLAVPYQELRQFLPEEVLENCPRQFYLRKPDGKYLGGGEALLEVIRVSGCEMTAAILKLPGLRQVTGLVYKFIAGKREFFSQVLFR